MSDEEPIAWGVEDPAVHLTQCCGAMVWIYTDYREDGELMIPICFACKKQVKLNGEELEVKA